MTPTTPLRRLLGATALVALTFTAVSCGSDDDGSGSSAETTVADGETEESYEIVPDDVVSAGLDATVAGANALSLQIGKGADVDGYEEVFEIWESYEGTVKQNDQDTYLAIEDSLAALKGAIESEDTDAGTAAVADLTAAADAYKAAHP